MGAPWIGEAAFVALLVLVVLVAAREIAWQRKHQRFKTRARGVVLRIERRAKP